jgi:hypothetical protein
MTPSTPNADEALRAVFRSREKWFRWPAAAWLTCLAGVGIAGTEVPLLLGALGLLSTVLLGFAFWAWRCPRCGKELELAPKKCRHCGLCLRQGAPAPPDA